MKKILFIVLTVLFISSCSSPRPWQDYSLALKYTVGDSTFTYNIKYDCSDRHISPQASCTQYINEKGDNIVKVIIPICGGDYTKEEIVTITKLPVTINSFNCQKIGGYTIKIRNK